MMKKKRKFCHKPCNKLAEVIKACDILDDDSDKIQLVIDYIKQLKIDTNNISYPKWVK